MKKAACLAAGAIVCMAIVAGAPPRAAAMPVNVVAQSTSSSIASSNSLTLFASRQAADPQGSVTLRVFGYSDIANEEFNAPRASELTDVRGDLSLTLARLFDLPVDGALPNSKPAQGSLVSDAVFGVEATASMASGAGAATSPITFVAISAAAPSAAIGAPAIAAQTAAIGLKFKVLGSENTIAYEDVNSQSALAWLSRSAAPFSADSLSPTSQNAGIGFDPAFTRLALGGPISGSLLDPAEGSFAAPAFAPADVSRAGAPGTAGTFAPDAHGTSVQLNLPLTLGNVEARLSLSGRDLRDVRPALLAPSAFGTTLATNVGGRFEEFRGGVTLGVPVFKRKAEVSLNGVVDRLIQDSKTSYAYGAAPSLGLSPFVPAAVAGLTGSNPTLTLDPNYVNLRRYVGAYSVAVPIGTALTANMQYVGQRFGADSLNANVQDLNVGTTSATFGVLYKIPNTNASINLNFNQYKFQDGVSPLSNFVQNRQNLYFTVKF